MKSAEPINDLHPVEPRWFAVRTRSKSEKFVRRMLEKKGVEVYLPLQQFLRRYARSKRVVEKPLINCYVFARITQADYVPVLETENVVGFVKFNKDLIAIKESEIETIRRITLETTLEVQAIPGQMHAGDWVEISAGTLMGLKGKIVKQEGKRKFQIELAGIGISLLISVDAAFLEKLPQTAAALFSKA